MLTEKKALTVLLLLIAPVLAFSQQSTYPLYQKEAPLTKKLVDKDGIGDGGRITQVAIPQLTVYRPQKNKSNGKAILICPGGGYRIIAIQHEGHQIARWYSERGYTAAVLKYRLPEEKLLNESWRVPLMDAEEGIRFLRKNAVNWNYNPEKIGVLGFSAGGHLASSVSVHHHPEEGETSSSKPNFSILVYPVISMDTAITHQGSRENLLGEKLGTDWEDYFSNEKQVKADTPPAFLVHSWDDGAVPVENSIRYAKALNNNGIPVELHLFQKGGHGYGSGNFEQHGNAATWLEMSDRWISDLFK